MFKFMVKVVVGSIGAYVVTRVLEETKLLERVVDVGIQVTRQVAVQTAQGWTNQEAARRAGDAL